jgi:hypothetical protein
LNPATRPFSYLVLNGKTVLYANKDCTDQLRKRDQISITIPSREVHEDVYVVTARAQTPNGRTDESTGAVAIAGLRGDAKANAMMKAETKAKRRAALSICGLGILDETEVQTIPAASYVEVDQSTGEIIDEIDTGGEKPGTKAAAQAVAKRKIAEAQAKAPRGEHANVPAPVLVLWDRMKTKKGCIEECSAMKAAMMETVGSAGEAEYYRILGTFGVKHANEFPKGEDARNCILILWESLQQMKLLDAANDDEEGGTGD